ncbi:MAG TPA: hypothetical protein EYO08_05120 [Candidatus Marinimicrobia bacterium]|nr:hypothetical protein [Candidatus Neomarinimicrobiota bacterium]
MHNKLIALLILTSSLFAGGDAFIYRPEFHSSLLQIELETTVQDDDSTTMEKYPAKGLLYSLVLPGAGQWYAGAKLKSLAFVGVEISSILLWSNLNQQGDDIKIDYEALADNHWILDQWLQNMYLIDSEYGISAIGTHDLKILLADGTIIGSNEDENENGTPDWDELGDEEVLDVIRDRDFYENIGKYNQFVGGWDDITDSLWYDPKSVGDSTEWLVMTDNRDTYLDLRQDHNQYLQYAGYAVSAIMFNHVLSAIDAVWETSRRAKRPDKVEASLKPIFSPSSKFGIGGFSLSLKW